MTGCLKFVLKYASKKKEGEDMKGILIMAGAGDGYLGVHYTILCSRNLSLKQRGQGTAKRTVRSSLECPSRRCPYPTS